MKPLYHWTLQLLKANNSKREHHLKNQKRLYKKVLHKEIKIAMKSHIESEQEILDDVKDAIKILNQISKNHEKTSRHQ